MKMAYSYTPAVEADRRLLPYKTYEDYLDSLVKIVDLRNLRSTQVARIIATLGYRSTAETFTEKEFKEHRAAIEEVVKPSIRPLVPCSLGLLPKEPLARALAEREKTNRMDQIHTIIFVRLRSKIGYEISGYIDYADRLANEDWTPFFREETRLKPLPSDLSYYHWKSETVLRNLTRNFEAVTVADKGHIFHSRHDHLTISLDPNQKPGPNTIRQRVHSPKYAQIELYDHILRIKI